MEFVFPKSGLEQDSFKESVKCSAAHDPVQCALYSFQCAVYSVQCAVYRVQFALCSMQCAVCSVQCAV